MKKQTLIYRFHDPNPPEVTAEFLAKLFVEVNAEKVHKAVLEAANANAQHEVEQSCPD
jgi:ribosomal protein L22